MSTRAYQLERDFRERAAFLTDVRCENEPARAEMYALLERERASLAGQDAHRLACLIDALTAWKG